MNNGVVTCSINNELLATPNFKNENTRQMLRIAVKNGIGAFHSLEVSPATESK